ncbi:MAG TPA: hypothetical protein VIW02_05860, partial [Gammaproteobacteria bacterium]
AVAPETGCPGAQAWPNFTRRASASESVVLAGWLGWTRHAVESLFNLVEYIYQNVPLSLGRNGA